MDLPIYCINLAEANDRKQRMVIRFEHHHLSERVHFVEAITKSNPVVDLMLKDFDRYTITDTVRAEAACLFSHIKALKMFLQSKHSQAIICEDDIMLHNNFSIQLDKIMENCPKDISLVSLGYIILFWDKFEWGGIVPERKNLRPIVPSVTWGCQCYLINREYANKIIKLLDKPFKDIKVGNYITSELILKESNGLVSWPPLAIEEVIDSQIRTVDQLDTHLAAAQIWGYFNYANAEQEHRSQLYEDYQNKLSEIQKKYRPRRLLWISRLGFPCSYSYVSTHILKGLVKTQQIDLFIFCTGIIHTSESRNRISQEIGLPTDRIYILDQVPPQIGNCQEDQEFIKRYYRGIYHLPTLINKVLPDIVISIDDNITLNQQAAVVFQSSHSFRFIPYLAIDCKNIPSKTLAFPSNITTIMTMTNFGKKEIQKIYPQVEVLVVPHIVDTKYFYPLPKKRTLRKKWLGIDFENKFIIGAINANNTRKRWDLLFHAFGLFAKRHSNVSLLIKVDSAKPQTSQQYDFNHIIIEACKVYCIDVKRIKLLEGNFNESDLNEIYNCCDVGLTTSSGEGWGLIPCEMALCKIPQLMPRYSSFPEIFPESTGLIPVEDHSFWVGRELSKPAEDLIHTFQVLLKSYLSHESKEELVDQLDISPGVTTICISPHGQDQLDGKINYNLPYPVKLVKHFRTFKYAANYLKKCKLSERFQVLINCDPKFLSEEWSFLDQLKDSICTKSRHLLYNKKTLEKYWNLQSGSVGIPTINDVVITLEKFYQNSKLRQKEGEYVYKRIEQICNQNKIISQLIDIINN